MISGGIVRPKLSGGSENPSSANRSRARSHRGLRPVDEREREAIAAVEHVRLGISWRFGLASCFSNLSTRK